MNARERNLVGDFEMVREKFYGLLMVAIRSLSEEQIAGWLIEQLGSAAAALEGLRYARAVFMAGTDVDPFAELTRLEGLLKAATWPPLGPRS